MVQWLRLCASSAGGGSSIPGQGTKISCMPCSVARNKQMKKMKEVDSWLGLGEGDMRRRQGAESASHTREAVET